jgi:hypothetical protein
MHRLHNYPPTQVQVVPDVLPHSFEEFRKTLR